MSALTLHVHPVTFVTLDYGDELDRCAGLAWSWTGKAEDAHSFERDFADRAARDTKIERALGTGCPGLSVALGEAIERRRDLNPHGLV